MLYNDLNSKYEKQVYTEYAEYKKQWLKEHISRERFMKLYFRYLNDSIEDYCSFDDYIEEYGFDGELYVCIDEWYRNDYNEEQEGF